MPSQKTIPFAPIASSASQTRGTPRRNASTITNYARPERIDEIIQNPPQTPRAPARATQADTALEDTEMDYGDEDDEEEQEEAQEGAEVIEILDPDTPTQRNLPSTVITKTRRIIKRARKPRSETTWTQFYYDVTLLDDTWVNTSKKGHPVLQNRLWTCKWCKSAFSSTDKSRHGNTSTLNNHLLLEHNMTKQKHQLGIQPEHTSKSMRAGALSKYVVPVEAIPTAEEAVLQFFALTNQPFEMIESKGFKNLYRSVGTTCPIESANTLNSRMEDRFNTARRDIKSELDITCETFSISFDGWSSNNHHHILGAIAHWLTPHFERRSMVTEFAEMTGGKSGEAMADIIWESLGPDYKKTTKDIKDGIITTTVEERVGLNCAQKLFAVCGDNATNNDTTTSTHGCSLYTRTTLHLTPSPYVVGFAEEQVEFAVLPI